MVATTADILKQQAAGKYVVRTANIFPTPTGVAATATSGFMNFAFSGNTFGTTLPNTIQTIAGPTSVTSEWMAVNLLSARVAISKSGIGRIYKLGTCDFTALGEAFTHDAATFPLLRNEMGGTSIPQGFIPILQFTGTAGTVAVQFQIRNTGSTAGYVNQAGTTVVGNKTFVFPTASMISGSMYFLPLNDGDSSCRDITNIFCTVNSINFFANIWLVEDLGIGQGLIAGAALTDNLYGSGLRATQCAPATATAGTATTSLVGYSVNTTSGSTVQTLLSLSVVP